MTIPEGYMVKTERRPGLYITGAALLGSTYIISTLSATIAMEEGDPGIWPLYIPVVGPFITLATMDNRTPTSAYFLVLDGLAQAAGVGMLAGGLAGKSWIVPIPRVAYDPNVGQAEAGVQLVGLF